MDYVCGTDDKVTQSSTSNLQLGSQTCCHVVNISIFIKIICERKHNQIHLDSQNARKYVFENVDFIMKIFFKVSCAKND